MKTLQTVSFGAIAACLALASASAAVEKGAVPASTPGSVTIIDVTNSANLLLWKRLGDGTGRALYTYNKDETSGKSSCVDECAKEFPPFTAPAGAVAFGDWSVVNRADGVKQWAYQGRPLHTYAGKDPTENPSGGRARANRGAKDDAAADPGSSMYTPKDDWKRAAFVPDNTNPAPAGIALKSIAAADGYGFVSSATNMVLYVMKTAPKNPNQWMPSYAPGLAVPIGDFSIVEREDGKRQWAYKGQLLYSFKGDYSASDLNGLQAEKDVQPALAVKNFMPAAFQIMNLPARGPLMTTTKGQTVYTQARFNLQYGGRETREGYSYSYADAKVVGTKACTEACLKTWQPVAAPANAQPGGSWEIAVRADGTHQWAYKGSPLYTYVGDKKLGDIEGNNRHDILYGDKEGKVDLSLTGGDRTEARNTAGSGFYWHTVGLYN